MSIRSAHLWPAVLAVCLSTAANVEARQEHEKPRGAASRPRDYPHPRLIKLVYDLNTVSPNPSDVNPGLVAIAGLIRQYKAFGKDSPRLKLVVVLHGKTTELAVDAASTARRAPGTTNGSIDLMRSMAADGIDFVVSRQALTNRTIAEDEIQSFVRLGPTAEIIFLDLEASGYIFSGSSGLGSD